MRAVSKRIITVEDIYEFIDREETLLRREDLNLVVITSGEEALFRARNDKPDLLIMNFHMPDLNGYQVCRKLKGDDSTEHIPVLILATPVDEDNDPGYLTEAAGCDGCIEKPIQQKDILPLLVKLLQIPTRRHLRKNVSIKCSITDEDGQRIGTILNMTPEGFFVETTPAPWPGDIVTAEFSAADSDAPGRLQLAVRWSRDTDAHGPQGAGCEYLNPSPEMIQWLTDQIASSRTRGQ